MNQKLWRVGLAIAVVLALLVGMIFHWIPPYAAAALSVALALLIVATRGRPRPAGDLAARAQALRGAGASPAVADLLARGQKINAIKAYREESGAGLREAKAAVEQLERALA